MKRFAVLLAATAAVLVIGAGTASAAPPPMTHDGHTSTMTHD